MYREDYSIPNKPVESAKKLVRDTLLSGYDIYPNQNCFRLSELRATVNFAIAWGSKGGAVVRALASHPCGPGSNPGVDGICGLSLLLVLSFAPRGFSPGTPVFPSP